MEKMPGYPATEGTQEMEAKPEMEVSEAFQETPFREAKEETLPMPPIVRIE